MTCAGRITTPALPNPKGGKLPLLIEKDLTMKIVFAAAVAASLASTCVAHAQETPFDRAVSLVAVVFFEVDHCPGVVVNGPIFKTGLSESGADLPHDNEAIQKAARVSAESMHEKGDAAHCAELWAQLGPDGTDVTGLLARAR